MKKLYAKNELAFALVWIAVYVAGTSLAEALSETIGTYKLFPLCSILRWPSVCSCGSDVTAWQKSTACSCRVTVSCKPGFLFRWRWYACINWSSARLSASLRRKASSL